MTSIGKNLIRVLSLCSLVILTGDCSYNTTKSETGESSLANRKKWHDWLQVRVAKDDESIGTTQTQISNVSEELAAGKMNQALEAYDGNLPYRLSTVFHIAQQDEGGNRPAITAVVVKGHYYYVAALDYPTGNSNRAAYQATNGKIPAVAVADAEDETKPAWIRMADEQGHPYEITLYHGTQAVMDDKNILRHLRNAGYGTAVGSHSLDNPTLEFDDNWRPYFTVTYDNNDAYLTVGDNAMWPDELLVVDAQTRKIDKYALDDPSTHDKDERDPNIPTWVDQIYSPEVIRDWIGKWGYNPDNYGKTSELNHFVLDGGHLDQVMNRANTNLTFVAYITSTHPDNSLVGVMLVDPRTAAATFYSTKGTTKGMAGKSTAINTISQATHRWGYKVEDLTLHTIYGVETWEGVLSRPSYNDDGREYGSLYCGTVLLKADADLKPANVIWATSKQEAFTKYERHLYLSRTTRVGSNVLEDKELKGVVSRVQSYVEDGNTSYLIMLEDHPHEVYEVPILFIGDTNTEDVLSLGHGDKVYLHYADPDNQKTFIVREIRHLKEAGTPRH